jgi:hypothetical protein
VRRALIGLTALALLVGCAGDKAVQFVTENLDDACFYAGTLEGTFAVATAGRLDAAGEADYAAAKGAIDALCTKPYPADTKQTVAKLAALTAQLVVTLVPPPAVAAK